MSDSQAYEEVAISSDGVSVIKRFEEDEFPVPAIAFEFMSEREEEVTVRLTDEVPEGVEVEDLGFHPEYGSEFWTIDDDTITFERALDAHSDYTTVYGIRATGADDVEQFLTEPVIEEVDPPLPDDDEEEEEEMTDDIIPESDDDVVRDVISGDGEVPGLEDEEPSEETDEEEIETLDLKDPNAPADQQPTVTSEDDSDSEAGGEDEATEDVSAASTNGSVVAAMATEIRQNNVSVDDLRLLQRAIDQLSDQSSSGATDARIDRLQADISDLRAYTDALEEFLDENGTGEQLIEEFDSKLETFRSDLDELENSLAEMDDTVERVDSDMDEVQSEVDTMSADVEDVEATLSDIEASVDDLDTAVSDLESEVEDGDVAERMDEIEREVAELREWQDQIKSTFGG